jgi:hypothetical protein
VNFVFALVFIFSFQAFVLKGSHPHLGNENFSNTRNNQKNIKSGKISFIIFEKKFSFSVLIFI